MGRNLRSVFTRCDAPLPLGRKYVAVKLITNQTLYFAVELKCTVQDVFDQLCCYLGIVDSQLFGLAKFSLETNEFHFVEQQSKFCKLAPKSWKSPTSAGLDGHGRPLIVLYLRIQYFVDCMMFLQDRVACHHYYHQVKHNLISYDWAISQELAFLLASYALQADMGNYDPVKCRGRYFDATRYFPGNIVQTVGEAYIISNLPLMHRDNHNINRSSAQIAFIKEASQFAMHIYKVHQKKSNYDFTYLGISSKGIQVFQPIATPVLASSSCNIVITKESAFPWSDISKLTFERRRFEVRLVGRCRQLLKFVYICFNEVTASSILNLCRLTHQFNLAIQPRLTELKKVEKRNKMSKYRESYIYSDPEEISMGGERTPTKSGLSLGDKNDSRTHSPALSGSDQRISVISSASSNTTSGIMSDKPQSHESEDEMDLSPVPVALSLESLTTARGAACNENGVSSDYGTLENISKRALSEHNLSYHNKLHSKGPMGGVVSYTINGLSNVTSSQALQEDSKVEDCDDNHNIDKAISLDNIALANASLYHSKPSTDLRIAVSYVDAMKANSEEYLTDSMKPQKATPLYNKKPQLKAAPQPATRSTSFAGHHAASKPPPVKPRTKIGISSLSRQTQKVNLSEPEMLHLANSQSHLQRTANSVDSLDSGDVLDELRSKSSQHNLPLMSALCSDRTLHPKTVPTLKSGQDTRRFSYCSYLTSDPASSPTEVNGSALFKYTSLGDVSWRRPSHPPTPPRQMIPHKLSCDPLTPVRKAVF